MAISKDDVKKLAELSRIELSDAEMERMRGDIEAILGYVETIQKIDLPDGVGPSPHLDLVNVMREDGNAYESDLYSEKLLAQAPRRDGRSLKVKKILG